MGKLVTTLTRKGIFMLHEIYIVHVFGWWTAILLMMMFKGMDFKRLALGNWIIPFATLVYAVPSTGFHYFLLKLIKQ
jgi:hypothetical protein